MRRRMSRSIGKRFSSESSTREVPRAIHSPVTPVPPLVESRVERFGAALEKQRQDGATQRKRRNMSDTSRSASSGARGSKVVFERTYRVQAEELWKLWTTKER